MLHHRFANATQTLLFKSKITSRKKHYPNTTHIPYAYDYTKKIPTSQCGLEVMLVESVFNEMMLFFWS